MSYTEGLSVSGLYTFAYPTLFNCWPVYGVSFTLFEPRKLEINYLQIQFANEPFFNEEQMS
jgi:hypothetical protein